MVEPPEPTRRTEPIWLEPYPDVLLEDIPDRSPGPEARYEAREAVELVLLTCLERCRVSEGSRRSRVALGDDNVVAERHSVNDRTAGAR
jgi:hypothetical protein